MTEISSKLIHWASNIFYFIVTTILIILAYIISLAPVIDTYDFKSKSENINTILLFIFIFSISFIAFLFPIWHSSNKKYYLKINNNKYIFLRRMVKIP